MPPIRLDPPVSTRYTFTSESVTEGHPDKMADQISDSVLDALIAEDPDSRVACETLLTTGLVLVAGEITTSTYVDIPKLVRKTVLDIGYDDDAYGIDGNTCGVIVSIDEQSPNIGQGVDNALEVRAGTGGEDLLNAQGAGDQGMMFGYACDETPDLMPLPIWLAHRLAQRLAQVRRVGVLPYLRPDGKTQVSVVYEDGKPVALETVLISTQHDPGVDLETLLLPDLRDNVINPLLPPDLDCGQLRILANPTGVFELGGPHADTGLTGRKIIVDTYGGMARHGGGAFSGKDPSKVDRSAAYAARWVAKNLVAAGAATRCEVQVAYAIGVARPVSVLVETFGTEPSRSGTDRGGGRRGVRSAPRRHRRRPGSQATDLPEDGRLRSLRSGRQGVHLGGHLEGRRRETGPRPLSPPSRPARPPAHPGGSPDRIVRVVPDVAAIHRRFDYSVPSSMDGDVKVGSRVRIDLHGRRVGAWVVEDDVEATTGVAVKQLAASSGLGPPRRWCRWPNGRRGDGPVRCRRSSAPPLRPGWSDPGPSTGAPGRATPPTADRSRPAAVLCPSSTRR